MYPEGHPSLAPAAEAATRRARELLLDRRSLSVGVARLQLIIEGVATDPAHPLLRELASRLHRHHLGALTFRQGLEVGEVTDMLRVLAVEPDRGGQPLGLAPPERLPAWPHVQLHPLTYERLELVEGGAGGDARAAQLWVGLARAALAMQAGDGTPPTEPAEIARAIDEHAQTDDAAYDQVIVGYLLQIADELKNAKGAEALALRRRTAGLIRSLRAETLRRLVEMGGDVAQRHRFVHDASLGMAPEAILQILQAAAQASEQTISHSLLRMLTKLAAHADSDVPGIRAEADTALREQVRRLLADWTLADPNPAGYSAALGRMARLAPQPAAVSGGHPVESDRIVLMALEVDTVGPQAFSALDRVVDEGHLGRMLDRLERAPELQPAAEPLLQRIATPEMIRQLVGREPPDIRALESLIPKVGVAAAVPLLDALVASESRTTRRALLSQLTRMGSGIAPLVVERVSDERWYVTRNMLHLLDELATVPSGFSAASYLLHDDARVRWQAVRLQLKVPTERDEALLTALKDSDDRTVRLGLVHAQQACPDAAVPLLASRATNKSLTTDLRVLAIRALGVTKVPAALKTLLQVSYGGRTFFGREKLASKTPELLAALGSLATGWGRHPSARARLALAARSSDPEIRMAADPLLGGRR